MKLRNICIVALGLLVVAFGCSRTVEVDNQQEQEADVGPQPDADAGTDAETDAETEDEHSIDAFRETSARLISGECERMFDCCNQEELAEQLPGDGDIDSVEECVEKRGGQFGDAAELYNHLANEGKIAFDSAQVDVCQDAIANLSCEDFESTTRQRTELPGCRNIIEPLVEEGEPCEHDFVCKTGTCDPDEDGELRCLPTIDEQGEDCSGNRTCGEGLYCEESLDALTCEPQHEEGEGCMDDRECLSAYCEEPEDADHNMCLDRGSTYCTGD